MKNFNSQDDDDFNFDTEDVMNRSMHDMDRRVKSKNTQKPINNDDGVDFFNLSDVNSQDIPLFKERISTESKEYLKSVFKGFVFIFMFFISLFALYLMFSTPDSFYVDKQSGPILLEESETKLAVDPFSKDAPPVIEEDKTSKIPQASEDNLFVDESAQTEEPMIMEDETTNKKDTALTKFLKSTDDNSSKKVVAPEDKFNTKELLAEDKTVVKATPTVKTANKDENPTIGGRKVWLVNVYSGTKKSELQAKLDTLKKISPQVFNQAKVYFTESQSIKGHNYRISLAKADVGGQYPAYANLAQAKRYCASLKLAKLDCFPSAVLASSLQESLIK